MDCTDFLARYTDYDDSLVSPDELAAFRAHMNACAPCARYDRVLRKGRMLARQLPPPSPSPDFVPRLAGALSEAGAELGWSRARNLAASVAVGVALLIAGTSGLHLLRPPLQPPAAAGDDAAARVGAEPAVRTPAARSLTLPPAALAGPSTWTGGRVDRRVASSYSPLVIGPPAYRASRSVTMTSTTISRRTLD